MTSQPLTPEQAQQHTDTVRLPLITAAGIADADWDEPLASLAALAASHELLRAERDAQAAELRRWRESEQPRLDVSYQAQDGWRRAEARAAAGAEAVQALREAVPALDELIGWVNTDVIGCVDVQARGEKALRSARAAVEAYEEATGGEA
jgi:hypothetical protein